MLKMNIHMPMRVSQLDWLTRPLINVEPYTTYQVSFDIKISTDNFYSVTYDYKPISSIRLTTPEEENSIKRIEEYGIDRESFRGKELRTYLLDLKKKLEKEISEIGFEKETFIIDVKFEIEEEPDLRVY